MSKNDIDFFIPRTGIEQVFMKSNPSFIRSNREFEPIYDSPTMNKSLSEEYKMKDLQRTFNMNKVVYDCLENSPYYPNSDYLKPSDIIPMPILKDSSTVSNKAS